MGRCDGTLKGAASLPLSAPTRAGDPGEIQCRSPQLLAGSCNRAEAITAVIVLKEGASLTEEAVRSHVKGRLADYKAPKRVDFVAELPRNQSGKLLKRELRAERAG